MGWSAVAPGLIAALIVACCGPAARATTPVDLELLLAVDISGSIDPEEAQLQRDGYLAALVDPQVIGAVRGGYHGRIAVAYVEWAGAFHQRLVADWTVIEDEASARRFAAKIAETPVRTGPWTSISGVIDFATPLFPANAYEGTRKVIDISGDGPNNQGAPLAEARERAIAAGITINGLPIVNDRPGPFGGPPPRDLDRYYEACVIGGPRAFMVVAESFRAFAQAIRRKLIIEIADLAPTEPESLPEGIGGRGLRPPAVARPVQNRAVPACDAWEERMRVR